MRTWTLPAVHPAVSGPWDDEPDLAVWTDETTGIECLARRARHIGSWCGYVGVPPGHPWHRADYETIDVDVHGGLSFGGIRYGLNEGTDVWSLTETTPADDLWWLGFDCAHYCDLVPVYLRGPVSEPVWELWDLLARDGATYKDFDYAVAEVTSLATQAHAAATSSDGGR